jgi:hypothetical protein
VPSTPPKRPDSAPTLFTDRSLAKNVVPKGIRALGFDVVTIWDLYGEAADTLDDDVWLRDSTERGWPSLTWDYLREWRDVIVEVQAKVFRFERRMRTPAEKLATFEVNRYRLIQRCQKAGGWIDVFRERTIDRYWP